MLVVDAAPGGFESGFAAAAGAAAAGGGGGGGGGGQTREHVQLARSLGIERLIVAVSKMDGCGYSQARFEEIKAALGPFLKQTGFKDACVSWVPVSAGPARCCSPSHPPHCETRALRQTASYDVASHICQALPALI